MLINNAGIISLHYTTTPDGIETQRFHVSLAQKLWQKSSEMTRLDG